tara:strand:+ start:1327 stop:1758 length:432 start_codon:yes stop_codon:yes gene_type:complete
LEDLKKMSTSEYYNKKITEASRKRTAKNKAELKKKQRAAKKKWKDRGSTGYREREKANKKAGLEWGDKDTQITFDTAEDYALVDEHGKDAPKARSFLTPSRKRSRKDIGKSRYKTGKKGGGSVRQGRGMGAALRGGGAVTRSK